MAPGEIVRGALAALADDSELSVRLVGREAEIREVLEGEADFGDRLTIVPAADVVGSHESPVDALRRKRDNRISRSVGLVAEDFDRGLVPKSQVHASHRHFLLQSFNEQEDFEINTVTGFKYPISGHLSSVIQLEYDYDNLPAEAEVDKKDQKWSIGLNYDW